jgi:hypothetical protein
VDIRKFKSISPFIKVNVYLPLLFRAFHALNMKFGICTLSVVPVRTEASDKAEIGTQLLFGELAAITGNRNQWLSIRILDDNYEGWIDQKQIQLISEKEFSRMSKEKFQFTKDLVGILQDDQGNLQPALYGSTIRNANQNQFRLSGRLLTYSGELSEPGQKPETSRIIEDAFLFLQSPYLWGGKSPFGIDCSGLTQLIFKTNGINLLRNASQQATQGETIALIDESEAGDLAFFDNDEGNISHVGILRSKTEIIHASGRVRKDKIDHIGIFNDDLKKYTHRLRTIKRLI